MARDWLDILARCKYNPKIVLIILSLLRIAICFWPQKGYLHPDEFFQSSDICGGRYFKSYVQPVWEFRTDKPIRNMLIPTALNSIAFYTARLLQEQPSTYLLLVAPRLVYTLSTFVIDLSLYKLCQYYSSRGLWYLPVSLIFQSSFICLGCLTRTFNNVIETIIFALFLVVVCRTVRPTFRIYLVTPSRSTPINQRVTKSKQLVSSLAVGTLLAIGVFNRPTFLCFAIVPTVYWFIESWKRNSYSIRFSLQRVIVPMIASAFLTSVLMSSFDTFYYKGFHIFTELLTDLTNLDLNSLYTEVTKEWVITPYNFIKFNTNSNNLSKFGLHAPYFHFLINIPLAFNILGLLLYRKTIRFLTRPPRVHLNTTIRIHAVMLLTTLSSVIILSFIPHQEFRFLLPLIIPLAYVFAFKIYSSNRLLSAWLSLNLITFLFYSCIHQSGPISASLDLGPKLRYHLNDDNNQTFINVVAFQSYLVPTYHWNIPRSDQRFYIDVQDSVDDFQVSLEKKLSPVMDRMVNHPDSKHRLYIFVPQLFMEQLISYLQSTMSDNELKWTTLGTYTSHFSGENFHESINLIRREGISMWTKAFGFSLVGLDLTKYAQS